ncbi:hypothetical protein A8924_5190 [Saccharopolyspora erythraea NRRL 2338]|nr:hypothetical protein A8924_5190 [Saccharopolyspora erythraea NRRL 2338]
MGRLVLAVVIVGFALFGGAAPASAQTAVLDCDIVPIDGVCIA